MKSRYSAFAIVSALFVAACAESPVSSEPTALTRHGGSIAFNAETAEGNTYLVRFKGNDIPADFATSVAALGGEVIFAHAGVGVAAVAGISEAGASGLSARSDIAAVDADRTNPLEKPNALQTRAANDVLSPGNPAGAFYFGLQWNMRQIKADQAWAAGKLGNAAVRVGILDTGLDPNHFDLSNRIDVASSRSFLSAKENQRVIDAWGIGTPLWTDLHYHGTHVGSTVASNGYVTAGVSSRTRLVALRVCEPGTEADGFEGTCPTSSVIAAILYAADIGLPVVNMSLGGLTLSRFLSARGGDGPSFRATVNAVFHYAQKKGTQIVVASGNDGVDLQRDFGNGLVGLYCDAPSVICVSATGPTASGGDFGPFENPDAIAFYSTVGKNHITVAAPGGTFAGWIWAACSSRTIVTFLAGCTASPTSIVGLIGTSMASPHVAGLAALIAAEGGHTPASITNRIIGTADDLGPKGKDAGYGSGRINVRAATQ